MERNEQLKRSAGLEMRGLTIPGLSYELRQPCDHGTSWYGSQFPHLGKGKAQRSGALGQNVKLKKQAFDSLSTSWEKEIK